MQVLLLDEITVDLDVLGRADLLAYLRAETEERGACIVYATHIFDGLEAWATHLMYLADGGLKASRGGWLRFWLMAENSCRGDLWSICLRVGGKHPEQIWLIRISVASVRTWTCSGGQPCMRPMPRRL